MEIEKILVLRVCDFALCSTHKDNCKVNCISKNNGQTKADSDIELLSDYSEENNSLDNHKIHFDRDKHRIYKDGPVQLLDRSQRSTKMIGNLSEEAVYKRAKRLQKPLSEKKFENDEDSDDVSNDLESAKDSDYDLSGDEESDEDDYDLSGDEESDEDDYIPIGTRKRNKKMKEKVPNRSKYKKKSECMKKVNKKITEKVKELSEFEKKIQKNREEKFAFLQSLGMDECKEEFKESMSALKPPGKKPAWKPKPKLIPRRSESKRSTKITDNLSEEAILRRIAEKAETLLEETKANKGLKPQNLTFAKSLLLDKFYEDCFGDFDTNSHINAGIKNTDISQFNQMKLQEKHIFKLMHIVIESSVVHPATDKIVVFVGNNKGHITVWNVTSNSSPVIFNPHSKSVTHIKCKPNDPFKILSSSRDGTMRLGDFRKKMFTEVFNVSEETSCSYFDFISTNEVIVSLEKGDIAIVDMRRKRHKFHTCHEGGSIKSVSVHPQDKNMFITGGYNGFVKLWDLRKLERSPICESPFTFRKKIGHCCFSPATGKSILSENYENGVIEIYNYSNSNINFHTKSSIKRYKSLPKPKYLCTPVWLPNSDDLFTVDTNDINPPYKVNIMCREQVVHTFEAEKIVSKIKTSQFHPTLPVSAVVTKSGTIFVFMDTNLCFD